MNRSRVDSAFLAGIICAIAATMALHARAENLTFSGTGTVRILASDWADYTGGSSTVNVGANAGGRLYWRGTAGDGQYIHFDLTRLQGLTMQSPANVTLQNTDAQYGGSVSNSFIATANGAWTAAYGAALPGATAIGDATNATGDYGSGTSITWGIGSSTFQSYVNNASSFNGLAIIGGNGSTMHFIAPLSPYLTVATSATMSDVVTVSGGAAWNSSNYSFTDGVLTINDQLAGGTSGAGDVVINSLGTVFVNGNYNKYWAIDSTRINTGGVLLAYGHSHLHNLTLAGGELAGIRPDGTYGTWTFDDATAVTGGVTSTISAQQVNLDNGTFTVDAGSTLNFPGSIRSGSITKNGAGTMRLTSSGMGGTPVNTQSGATVINGGTIEIYARSADNGGYTSLGTGAVTINDGGTLVSANDWSTGNEWNSGAVGTITINNGGTWTINAAANTVRNGLVLNGGTVNGTGANGDWGGMYLRSTSVTVGGTATSTIAVDTAMNGATTMTVDAGSRLNFSGVIHNKIGATGAITKAGAGTLVLSAANTYSGQTDITAGTLVAANNAALGPGGLDGNTMTFVRDGATLGLQGDISTDEHLHVVGTGVGGLGAIRNVSGDNTMTNWIGFDGNTTFGVDAGTLTFTNRLYGDGGYNASSLTKVGAGTLVLQGNNVLTGGLIVNSGTVIANRSPQDFGGDSSLGDGTVTVNNGGTLRSTAQWTTGSPWQPRTVGAVTINNGGTWSIEALGQMVKNGLYLNGSTITGAGANTDWGGLNLSSDLTASGSAVSSVSVDTALNGGRTITVDGGSQLNYSGVLHNQYDTSGAITKAGAGTLVLTGFNTYTGTTSIAAGTLQVGAGGTSGNLGPRAVVNDGTLAFNRSDSITVSNGIAGSGGLRQIGSGTLTLGGANTYTGATAIEQGTLKLLNPSIVGTASYTTASGVSFAPASNDVILGTSPISNVGGGAPEGTGTVTTLTDGNAGVGISYAYTVNNGQVITYQPTYRTNGYDLTGINIYSTWADSGRDRISLDGIAYSTVDDPGTFVTIPGSAVTYDPTGAPTLALAALSASGGSLATRVFQVRFNFGAQENNYGGYAQLEVVATPTSEGTTTNVLPSTTALQVAAGARLDLNGVSQTVAALTGAGSVINSAGVAASLVVDQAAAGTFSGGISGNTALTKAGSGALTLTGTSTHTGPTAVDAGMLVVNGNLLATAIVVASEATLGGSGVIGGPVDVLGGGIVAPGNSPGTLTVSNTFSLADTSLLAFELDAADTTVGGGINDLITGVTDLVLDGVLNVTGNGDFTTVAAGTAWRLFNYSGTLTDNTLEIGTAPTLASGLSFAINTSTANEVNLVVVPEPAGILLAGAGLALAAASVARRRRRQGCT